MAAPTKEFLTRLTDEQLIGALICDTTNASHYRREADRRSSRGLEPLRSAVDAWQSHRYIEKVKNDDPVPQTDTKLAIIILTAVIINRLKSNRAERIIPVVRSCFKDFRDYLPETWGDKDLMDAAIAFKQSPKDIQIWAFCERYFDKYEESGGKYTGNADEFHRFLRGEK